MNTAHLFRGDYSMVMRRTVCPLIAVLAGSTPAVGASQTPVAERTLENPAGRWIQRRTANANIYVLAGSAAAPLLPRLVPESERAIIGNLQWLGEKRTSRRLNLFFVGSRDEMRPFTGTRSGGWSVVSEGTAFLVANDSVRPALKHEIMHLLSWRHWGTPGGVWLQEGVATAAVRGCHEWTLEEAAASLYREGELATIPDMRRRFKTGGTQGAAHYLSAGSLVTFIDEKWGRDRLRQLWQSGGLASAQSVLGLSTLQLEQRWRTHVVREKAPLRWRDMARQIARAGCE